MTLVRTWFHREHEHRQEHTMTTTLEPWQIGVAILLILSLAVILKRVVILIALVRSHHWSEDQGNPTRLAAKSRHKSGFAVNGNAQLRQLRQSGGYDPAFDDRSIRIYSGGSGGDSAELQEAFADPVLAEWPKDEVLSSASTGFNPGSVAFVLPKPARVKGRRNGKNKRLKEIRKMVGW